MAIDEMANNEITIKETKKNKVNEVAIRKARAP